MKIDFDNNYLNLFQFIKLCLVNSSDKLSFKIKQNISSFSKKKKSKLILSFISFEITASFNWKVDNK